MKQMVLLLLFSVTSASSLALAQTAQKQLNLSDVRKLYIEPMGGVDSKGNPMHLQDYLRTEISNKLKNRITLVETKEEADAVMTGTGSWQNTAGATMTGRLMSLHDTATGAVSVEKDGAVLWSSEAGDRSLWWGVLARGGPRKVASRLVGKLKDALDKADHQASKAR